MVHAYEQTRKFIIENNLQDKFIKFSGNFETRGYIIIEELKLRVVYILDLAERYILDFITDTSDYNTIVITTDTIASYKFMDLKLKSLGELVIFSELTGEILNTYMDRYSILGLDITTHAADDKYDELKVLWLWGDEYMTIVSPRFKIIVSQHLEPIEEFSEPMITVPINLHERMNWFINENRRIPLIYKLLNEMSKDQLIKFMRDINTPVRNLTMGKFLTFLETIGFTVEEYSSMIKLVEDRLNQVESQDRIDLANELKRQLYLSTNTNGIIFIDINDKSPVEQIKQSIDMFLNSNYVKSIKNLKVFIILKEEYDMIKSIKPLFKEIIIPHFDKLNIKLNYYCISNISLLISYPLVHHDLSSNTSAKLLRHSVQEYVTLTGSDNEFIIDSDRLVLNAHVQGNEVLYKDEKGITRLVLNINKEETK